MRNENATPATTGGSASPRGRDVLKTSEISEAHRNQLFVLSCFALVTSGLVFSIRSTVFNDLGGLFALNAQDIGWGAGAWSIAFALAVFIGSPLCDSLGMGRILFIAALGHILGILGIIFAPSLVQMLHVSPKLLLYIGWFLTGIGSGGVEAAINPLAATLYPENKVHKLNVLHAWWPGGLIIGGLLAYFMEQAHINWQIRLSIILVPAIIYGFLALGQKFPATERVQAGVSTGAMFREAFQPFFLVIFLMMFLTAGMELAPGQWVDTMLTHTVGFQGILLLVYVSFLMFLFRFFAGPVAHRYSPIGLLWLSSALAGVGLYALSLAHSPVTALVAATIWAMGVCFMWPTMLGIASERFPKGGALLIGLMGTAGQLSIQFVLPWMGGIFDKYIKEGVAKGMSQAEAQAYAAPFAFRFVSTFAIVLIIVFGVLWLRDKAAGGYKAERI